MIGLILVSSAACDSIFGFEDRAPIDANGDGDAVIVPPDAHVVGTASGLQSFVIDPDPSMAPLAVLDVRGASATIIGMPHTFVPYALSATSGTFSPASGEIEIGATGSIVLASTFTAGGTAVGNGVATLTSAPEMRFISAVTVGLVPLGLTTQNGNFTNVSAGALVGNQVTASPGQFLKRIGLAVGTATNAYLGVYSDSGNNPQALLGSIGPVALAVGINEIAIPNRALPPTFWVVASLETPQASLPAASSVSTDRFFLSSSSYGPLPPSVSVISSTFGRFRLYVQATP